MKKTVLFVDDEEINLFVLEKRFEKDYQILTANSANEGIQIIREKYRSIDAVISDLKMPEKSGLDMIRESKEFLINIPCFLLTGYDPNGEIEEALSEKIISRLFKKPFSYNEISNTLREYLT